MRILIKTLEQNCRFNGKSLKKKIINQIHKFGTYGLFIKFHKKIKKFL